MQNDDGKIKAIFKRILDCSPEQRGAYLDKVCDGAPEIRREVVALLQAHEHAGAFLGSPTNGIVDAATNEPDADPSDTDAFPSIEPDPASPTDGLDNQRYKLLQKIGDGGFGTVYMAQQLKPVRRKVAIKVVKKGMDSHQVIARFEAERQALAMMDHPNIAKVFDAGETRHGRPFFVMELVQGIPITEYCDQASLDTDQRLTLFLGVCHAIQHAHGKGIIHRDIKPSNVMITLHDGIPVPKVIDFGIAKALHRPLTDKTLFTEYQQMMGTPEYMAPEQAEMSGLDIDIRADVYSLGVLLYELLTGTRPFEDLRQQGYLEMLRVIKEEDPEKPSTRVTSLRGRVQKIARQRQSSPNKLGRVLRGDLDWIVMTALEKDRNRRYPTANAMSADIEAHLDHLPITAGPPSLWYNLQKFVHRHKAAAAALGAISLSLVGGAGLALYGLLEARDRAAEAVTAKGDAERERDAARQAEATAADAQGRLQRKVEEVQRERDQKERARAATAAALRRSKGLRLIAESRAVADTNSSLSLLLAIEGARLHPGELANNALVAALRVAPGSEIILAADGAVLGPHGVYLAAITGQRIELRRIDDGRLLHTLDCQAPVKVAQFSPDGRRLLTTFGDGTAIWDVGSGSLQHRQTTAPAPAANPDSRLPSTLVGASSAVSDTVNDPTGHRTPTGPADFACFTPDGKTVLTGSSAIIGPVSADPDELPLTHVGQRVFTLTSATTGQPTTTLAFRGTQPLWVGFDASGSRILVTENGLPGHPLRVLDPRGEAPERRLGEQVVVFRCGPDPDLVATGGIDCMVRLFDLSTGAQRHCLEGHPGEVKYLEFSPDGKRLLSACNRLVRVWSVASGEVLLNLRHPEAFETYGTGFNSVPFSTRWFSADGGRILTSHADGSISIWDATSGEELGQLRGHRRRSLRASFDRTGQRVVSAGRDGTVRIWDPGAGRNRLHLVAGRSPTCLAVSRDGSRWAAGGRNSISTVWDFPSRRVLQTLVGDFREDAGPRRITTVFAIDFDPTGERVLTAGSQGVRIFDVATGATLVKLKEPGMVWAAEFSPDGRYFCTASESHEVRIRDAHTGAEVHCFGNFQPRGSVIMLRDTWAEFSPDGHHLLVKIPEHPLEIRDVATGAVVLTLVDRAPLRSDALFDPAGCRVAFTDYGKQRTTVFDTRTGARHFSFAGKIEAPHYYQSWDPSGQKLLMVQPEGDSGGRVGILDVATGDRCILPSGHPQEPKGFSSDGRFVATWESGTPKRLRVWDTATAAPVLSAPATAAYVSTFSPDARYLLVARSDGFHLYPTDPLTAALQHKPRELTAEERRTYEIEPQDGAR